MSKPMTEQEKKFFEVQVAANIEAIVAAGKKDKYDHYGIYCIKVDGKIVYVGKSRNMLKRVAQHMYEIEYNKKKNMYLVLKELKSTHHVGFDVLTETTEGNDDEMGIAEAYAIRHHSPCLNVQYPKIENYHSFDYCKRAKVITAKEVEEILDNDV